MKNIIERIAGGAKIARYLHKAVSTRLVVAALAVIAAGVAWAADSLEETGGSVTDTSTLAFKGVTLDEITAGTLHGRVGGGWMSGKVGNPWGFYVFDRSVTGQMKCEAQINDSGTIKGVRLVFTQSGDGVYVATDGTGVAAMRYKSGATLGESLFVDGTTTPSGNGSDTAYRVYNLSLTRSWSDSAVVIWEAGQFGVTSKTGSDGNTYTLDLNGNALSEYAKTITINQSVGVKVDFPSAKTSGVTVLFRYSDLTPSGEKALVFSTNSQDANRTGVYLNSTTAGQPTGIWNTTGDYTTTQNRNNMTSALSAGVFAFQYREGTGATSSNANGTSLYVLTNGVRYAIYTATGLKTDSNSYGVSGCTLGGMRTKTGATLKNAATGMKITGIAVFDGILSEAQMTSFVWPSAAAAEYAKWSYASYVLTCNSGFSNFESPNYSTFDLKSGYDIMPTYTTSVAPVKWQCFGYSKASNFDSTAYAAPGNVLRFVNASHACIAKFSPLTLGGMIVEPTATGCSLAQSEGSRSTILGDPTANAETWFKFDTGFSMARTGAYAIMGTVNLEINNSASVTFSGGAQISGAGEKAAGTNPSHTAGGVLKLHGNGSMAISSIDASDATLDYTDLSATSSTAADAYIQGTLTVNDSTVIALPAGATFPYFVASAASGTLDPANGVTIGGVAAPGYKLKSDGSVVAPRTVTISGNETWGTGTLNGWPTDDSTEGYAITVTADATLTLPSAVSCDVLSITVEDGVTLTISGNTITAAGCFYLTGNGVVKVTANNAVSATVKGDGTLLYQYSSQEADAVPSGAVFTDSEWTGTLWIKDFGNESYHSGAQGTRVKGALGTMVAFGNTYSKVKFTNVKAYYNNSGASSSCSWTLVLEDGEGENAYAWKNDSGWSNNNSMTIAALAGTGTYYDEYSTCTPVIYFTEASEFRGTIYNKGKKIGIGNTFQNAAGTICIGANKSVTVASGKTWTVNGGIVNNGTMALNGALSGTVTGSGTIVCGQGVDLSGSGFDSANWTGIVRLNGDSTIAPTTYYDELSYGNASSTLEIASGAVAITAATSLPDTVNVASGATLWYANSSATELTLAGSNSGTINLSIASALTTLNLNLTGNGSIVYPSSLTTLNVTYTESLADDGVKEITATGTALTDGTMTLVRPDGTEESVTGTVSGNKITFTWTPTVSGAACWIAYEMDYEKDNSSKTGFENSGSTTTNLSGDGVTGGDAFTDDGMLYTYAHPYRNDITDSNGSFPDNWTAVVRCTVPNSAGAAVITFGWNDSLIGLIAGDDPETEMKLVKSTGSAYEVLATMQVQDATSAQHVYVFSVENSSTIKVYCDGEQVLNHTYSAFTIRRGFQVGSVLGGVGSTGITRFWKGESPASTLSETVQKAARIDCVRLYKTVLGPNAIAQLSVEFPAVRLYRATVGENATTTWDALTWSPTWDGGNAYSKIILTAEGDASLTLPDSITADEFTINVASDSTLTLAKATGGTAMTVSKLEIDDGTVAVADANFFDSRAINGTGTLKITTTGALTSALSGNAKVEIPSGVAVGVTSGSIANTITGAGTLTYVSALPATAPTFSGWTGTVQLPAIATDVAINFNNYGIAGSTVAITSMTAGWIANAEVLPEINLMGNMTLNHFSGNWVNTFDKLSGAGTFTLAADGTADGYVDNYFLVKDVSDFTGSISVAAPGLAIGASKPASPTTYGQIYITTPVTLGSSATWTAPNGVLLADANATLTVPSGATVPVPTTSVAGCFVKATAGESTTVYSVAAKRTATVSVGSNVSLTINGSVVADGATLKFVPGDVLTIAASADTYYTPALTVNGVAQTSPYELTTTDADVTVSVTATLDTYTITIPSVANTTVSVSYTSGGEAQVATAAGAITVDAGTSLAATWTAVSGYRITANAGQTINPVVATQTLTSPTVEEMSAVVSNVNFTYGADYTTAEVTATIAGEATSATLTYGSNTYNAQVSNGTVTFTDVVVSRDSGNIYAPVSYTITTDAHATTGGAGSAVAADTTTWFSQSSANSGVPVNGSWTTAVNLSTPTNVTDNTFTTTESTSSRVVLEFNVCFSSVSDADVDGDAQGALKLGEVNSVTTFMVLTNGNQWAAVSNVGLTPDPTATNTVVMTFDYANNTYSVSVDNYELTDGSGSSSFPLAASRTGVKDIDFAGTGTLVSMKGDQLEGYMVVDKNGTRYPSIAAAISAYTQDPSIGPLKLLHAGTAPSGWRIDGDTLIKAAKGLFFMAF